MLDTLFEAGPNDPAIPPARPPRRPKVEADPNEPSPFGSAMPENLPPTEQFGKSIARVQTSGDKRVSKPRQHYPRVIALLEREIGGMFWPCDSKKIGYGNVQVSTDLLGFMDIQGIVDGRLIGINVTSKAGVAAHLRDYTNPGKTHGSGKVPVGNLLRRFLANGGRLIVFGYEKVGSRWQYDRTEVTPELLDQYVARKRGPKL